MSRKFKESLLDVLECSMEDLNDEEKINLVKKTILDFEKQSDYDKSNTRKPWSDEELKIVLSFAPTKYNCMFLAKMFKRGEGAITLIFRWASTSDKDIKLKGREDEKFISQVKRVAKEVGWIA